MSELEQKRFEKQNKDMLETMKLLESKIAELNKKLGSYDPEDANVYIQELCDRGAIAELRSELNKYNKLVKSMKDDNADLITGLFTIGGTK